MKQILFNWKLRGRRTQPSSTTVWFRKGAIMTRPFCRTSRFPSLARTIAQVAAIAIVTSYCASSARAQLIYQEGFNDDGEKANPPRYTTTGRDVFEVPRIISDLQNVDQKGPIYWAHNFEVSFVGIPAIPARRMLFAWNGANDTSTASQDFLNLFLSSVKWMLKDKTNAIIVVTPDTTAIGGLADTLTAAGYTVNNDDATITADDQVPGDLFIHAISGNASRFARVAKPVIVMNAPDWDDMIVGSIGTTTSFEPGSGEITTPAHPAAGGKTGTFTVASGSQSFHLTGRFLPQGATTLATVIHTVPPAVTRLGDVDDMIAGTKQSTKSTGQVAALDFADASPGSWFVDNGLPGGETGNWGLHAKGKLNVTSAGNYSVALGSDDGARLQIDLDKNGFSSADNVIEDVGPHAFLILYADVNFPSAGVYDFQIVSFNAGGGGGLEFSVAKTAGGGLTSALDSGEWDLVGADDATSPVKAQGLIDVNGYVAAGATTDVKEPLIVLLNGPDDTPPGSFYGGGQFAGFEGTGFFGASGLNKWPYPDNQTYRSLTLKPVDVTGQKNVKLTVALAGSQIDSEDSDYLDILAYPNGTTSTPVTLAHFRGVENGVQPWLADQKENFVRRLTRNFADFQYDIPTNATQLVIEFRAATTWWNELAAFDNVRITAASTTPPPPAPLSIKLVGNKVEVTFTGGVLASATSLPGSWVDVATTSPYIVTLGTQAGAQFFRTHTP
jgi:hypothetical protein